MKKRTKKLLTVFRLRRCKLPALKEPKFLGAFFQKGASYFHLLSSNLVETDGIEPTTSCLQSRRSTN